MKRKRKKTAFGHFSDHRIQLSPFLSVRQRPRQGRFILTGHTRVSARAWKRHKYTHKNCAKKKKVPKTAGIWSPSSFFVDINKRRSAHFFEREIILSSLLFFMAELYGHFLTRLRLSHGWIPFFGEFFHRRSCPIFIVDCLFVSVIPFFTTQSQNLTEESFVSIKPGVKGSRFDWLSITTLFVSSPKQYLSALNPILNLAFWT